MNQWRFENEIFNRIDIATNLDINLSVSVEICLKSMMLATCAMTNRLFIHLKNQ